MSIFEVLSQKLSEPLQLSLLSGLISSSYFVFGNLGAAKFGVVPIILADKVKIPVLTKVGLWQEHYDIAKVSYTVHSQGQESSLNEQKHMSLAGLVSGVSFASAAFLSHTDAIRYAAMIAAALSFTIGPFTLLGIFPTNNALIKMRQASTFGPGDEADAMSLLRKWNKLNTIRMTIGFGAWLVGLAAFVAK